jgi:hypothetical protein
MAMDPAIPTPALVYALQNGTVLLVLSAQQIIMATLVRNIALPLPHATDMDRVMHQMAHVYVLQNGRM